MTTVDLNDLHAIRQTQCQNIHTWKALFNVLDTVTRLTGPVTRRPRNDRRKLGPQDRGNRFQRSDGPRGARFAGPVCTWAQARADPPAHHRAYGSPARGTKK
jgi:hypothetical protein